MPGKRLLFAALLVCAVTVGVVFSTASGSSTTTTDSGTKATRGPAGAPFSFTGGIERRPVVSLGETFYKATAFNVSYSGSGPVTLSGSSDGTADTAVDDVLFIRVLHADGSSATFRRDYSGGCGPLTPLPPTDISSRFEAGLNKVLLTLKDKCGVAVSSSAIWISG